MRTVLFASVKSKVFVSTTPDLGSTYLKRSPNTRLYVYLHHSMVSMDTAYRADAFDNFDVIFCVGPHHVAEIAMRDEKIGKRRLALPVGYTKIDEWRSVSIKRGSALVPQVMVAPTWGSNSLLLSHGFDLIEKLINCGLSVCLRPHPSDVERYPQLLRSFEESFASCNFCVDTSEDGLTKMQQSFALITDWSGVAFEFSLGLMKPVAFIDLNQKIRNMESSSERPDSFEHRMRQLVGAVFTPGEWGDLVDWCFDQSNARGYSRDHLSSVADANIYNIGSSARVASEALRKLYRDT